MLLDGIIDIGCDFGDLAMLSLALGTQVEKLLLQIVGQLAELADNVHSFFHFCAPSELAFD